jgi:PKD repeat protein
MSRFYLNPGLICFQNSQKQKTQNHMKKKLLSAGVIALLGIGSVFGQRVAKPVNQLNQKKAQDTHDHEVPSQRCSTPIPPAEWDNWFNQKVEEYLASQQASNNGKMSSVVNYTIPVVVHVIHNGEAVGSGTNISNAQINSQITVLNADFAGTGLNNGNCPTAFSSLKANTGLTFCMALTDPSGNTLATPGVDRINRNTAGFTAPPYSSTTYIDQTIKPATIWNPTQYCNIWVLSLGGGLLGYATFPTGTGLSGISGTGTNTDDGVVIGYNYFGDQGNVSAPYNKGRTTTHELGHWLGLRHINGDSNCGSDFVTDTPAQDQLHGGCITSSSTYHAGVCSGTTGEMTMNFMDYTDDACMYMFTNGQSTRFQTCMANGTYRANLSNAAVTLCNATPQPPVAAFTYGTICTATATQFTNTSSGGGNSYVWSVNPSTGVTISSSTATSPTITFANAGSYTVTLAATNGAGTDSEVQTVTAASCAGMCDTISNFDLVAHTPSLWGSGGTGAWGWISGHNNYSDVGKADIFSSYTAGFQVTGAVLYFAKGYDAGTPNNVQIKVWDDNGTGGAPSTQLGTTFNLPISSIVTTGTGNVVTFASPISVTGPFFLGMDGLAYSTTAQDSVALIHTDDGEVSPGTAWEKWSGTSGWYAYSDATNSWGTSMAHAIFPIMCSATTGEIQILNNTSEVVIYPNPASNMLAVNVNFKKEDNVNIKVYNAVGQLVISKQVSNTMGGTFNLDLGAVTNGVYFVNVSTSQKNVTRKFIVEK